MRSSSLASMRFTESARGSRERGGDGRRLAGRAACLSFLLLASVAMLEGTARGQGDAPVPALESREAEWRRLSDGVDEAYRRGGFAEAVERATRALAMAETAFGPDHPNTLKSLNDLARSHQGQGAYAEAEPLYVRALAARERVLGRDHPDTLTSVYDLASLHEVQGRYAEAEPLYVRALAARERVLGREHPDTLTSVHGLGGLYGTQGRYAETEPLFVRALEARERVLGREHPDTLASVDYLAILYGLQGRYAEAEPLHLRALAGRERVLGREHPNTLTSVNGLAGLYGDQGRYAEAEPLYVRALETRDRLFGRDHPDTLISVNNLAWLYQARGRYAEAEPLYRRGLEAFERVLGREHSDTIVAVNNLAHLYQSQARYAEAEPLYIRALEASERVLGRDHTQTLASVNNLALLYQAQGRYGEAEPLFIRSLETGERVFGREHPDTLLAVNNLAYLYQLQDRAAEAEPLYIRALEASVRALGGEHPRTLGLVNNLAWLFQARGRYAEAEPLYARALEARERVLGRDHPQTLASVNSLAGLYVVQGRYAQAEPLFTRALAASERVLGREHPDTAGVAAGLATLRLLSASAAASAIGPARLAVSSLRSRRAAGAAGAFAQAQREREDIQRADYFALLADAAWSAAAAGAEPRPSLTAEGFVALQDATAGTTNRAVVQMAVRRVADATGAGLGALVRERESLADQWAVVSRAYSAALAGSDANAENMKRTLPAERSRIEARMDAIDATLRRDFPQYFALVRPEALNVATAQAMLAPDEAMLMVVPTRFGTHVVGVSRTRIHWVRSAWTRDEVDAAVRRLLWDVGAPVQVTPEQSAAWARPGESGYPYDRGTAHALYRQIVAPVAGVLEGKRHVFVVAGGSLTSLPFGLLVMREPRGADGDPGALRATSWFADAHALIQIPSIQSLQFLRRFGSATRRPNGGAGGFIGFGDPVLQGPPAQRGRGRGQAGMAASALFTPGRTRSGGAVVNTRQLRLLSRLPGTATELENIRTALGAPREALFLAERATEAALRSADLGGTRILALATHGLTAGEVGDTTEPGLVFTPPAAASEQDDGYLTSSEVAALRLDADWVILSACNTAAGDGSQGAPGLSGLARAFFYAGARNLLASHWPVRDDVAALLTVRTIQLLRDRPGLSRAEAFQRAMREIRDDPSHDGADDTWAHPSAWAPFTLIGDGAR